MDSNGFEAAALRLASTVQRALDLVTGTAGAERLTLEEAARALGCRLPATSDDLRGLALACEREGVAVNLDVETGGEWWRLRQAARAQLLDEQVRETARQLARPVLDAARVCAYCAGRRFGRAHGATLCHTCGALTLDREIRPGCVLDVRADYAEYVRTFPASDPRD
ncbi:MAG: hypothetical protein ACRD3G_12235 [Vicinamibacterales bacterium]